ncbi:hypothetical protein B7P43_G10255 [Cryptotermes secundus]|uniref:Uncharacterized protein n=1 Tax=Cryptotermes secundus TaxID=105785 RepID=A0A2J7PEE4_9NEOP|nr:hypothetical protein B7P43_G10255 [Cryptotermes secundus]
MGDFSDFEREQIVGVRLAGAFVTVLDIRVRDNFPPPTGKMFFKKTGIKFCYSGLKTCRVHSKKYCGCIEG